MNAVRVAVMGALVTFGALTLTAQAPAVPDPATALSETETAWADLITLASQQANAECQGLDTVKRFQAILREKTAAVEKRHPGLTADWSKRVLVPKPAQTAGK